LITYAATVGGGGGGGVWSWQDDYGWKKYDFSTSQTLETALVFMNAKNVSLTTGFFAKRPYYRVEFAPQGMYQLNTSTGYRRNVRRHSAAGVQYTPSDVKKALTLSSKKQKASSPHVPAVPASLSSSSASTSLSSKGGGGGGGGGGNSLYSWPSHLPKHLQFPTNSGSSSINNSGPFSSTTTSSISGNKRAVASILPKAKALVLFDKAYVLGPSARKSPSSAAKQRNTSDDSKALQNSDHMIKTMLKDTVKGVETMRGQRGQKTVTQMLQFAYKNGLFMHGAVNSPVNQLVVPALRYVINWCYKTHTKAKQGGGGGDDRLKKEHILNTLADACLDCQQVQAREMLRLFRELTNQAQTLELQISGYLNTLKEGAIDLLISLKHSPLCDQDHKTARPGQQRPHLRSAYVAMAGDLMGMHDTLPSKNDRFLYDAKSEVQRILGTNNGQFLANQILHSINPNTLFNGLLTDINNQSPTADRTIDRRIVFKWAQKGKMKNPHHVFYDEEREDEFKDQTPSKPNEENMFQPFLSKKILLELLISMDFLQHDPSYSGDDEKAEGGGVKTIEEAPTKGNSKTDPEVMKLKNWLSGKINHNAIEILEKVVAVVAVY